MQLAAIQMWLKIINYIASLFTPKVKAVSPNLECRLFYLKKSLKAHLSSKKKKKALKGIIILTYSDNVRFRTITS